MSTDKKINGICITATAITLIVTLLFMCCEAWGVTSVKQTYKYEKSIFDTSFVHTVDIVMDDFDTFISECENEEYYPCTVVIDGVKYGNIAIRAKGNTSLSNVKSMGSSRYSFKLEFDHYDKGKTLDGLDKLCLNNLIQDNTMMKDYLVYQMMNEFGVEAPLCSYAYITINNKDWGLYLAVEGVEESFITRNNLSSEGDLYKPDSVGFGGGRGNGRNFNMDDIDFDDFSSGKPDMSDKSESFQMPDMPEGGFGGDFSDMPEGGFGGDFSDMPKGNFGGEFPNMPEGDFEESFGGKFAIGFGGGMGSDDVKLKYTDDDPDSYLNIFDNAKTAVSAADKKRLMQSLRKLSTYSDLEDILDIDEVLRYFVVHNFVCNGDSYTGSMVHNYYLYENDGQLSMIPWDYNLAFGTFGGQDASSVINEDIDNPVSGGNNDDRPMLGWIFSDEKYTSEYHKLFEKFTDYWFADGTLSDLILDTAELIRPYVAKDPTKFCTEQEFEKGVETLSEFVSLRLEAVKNQLEGDTSVVDASGLKLSDMGSMNNGQGFKQNTK